MGREVRRVPPGWEHPTQVCEHSPWAGGCSTALKNGGKCYQPMFDKDFESEAREWLDRAIAWDRNEDPACSELNRRSKTVTNKEKHPFYWTWSGPPPDKKYYRPKWTTEEATCYQVYETISEGTPMSPVFETQEALIDWLVNDGGRDGKHSRKAAEAFVKHAWAPSMIFGPSGVKSGVDVYDDEVMK